MEGRTLLDVEWALHLGGSARLRAICASDAEPAPLLAIQRAARPFRPAENASQFVLHQEPAGCSSHIRYYRALSLKHTRTAMSHQRYGPLRVAALTLHSTKSSPNGSIYEGCRGDDVLFALQMASRALVMSMLMWNARWFDPRLPGFG